MKKLFIFTIKYIPVIQMAGILLNNIIFSLGCHTESKALDFILGNSVITTICLYVCSCTFGFCNWHRLLIVANLINILLASIDCFELICPTNFQKILSYFTIDIIFILIIIINKFKCKK